MAAGLRKGRNRLSLMLSFGSSHDSSSQNRSTSSQMSPMGFIDAFGLSSTTSLPVTPSHITPSPPLLSSPPPLSPLTMENPAPLPTVNNLEAQEKTRLLKQARKISQIFGEMPSMKEEDIQWNYRPSRDETRPVQRSVRSSSLMPTGNKLQRPAPRTRSRPTLNVRPTSPSLAAPTPQAAPHVPEIPASASASVSTPSTARTTPRSIAPPLPPDIIVPTPHKFLGARSERSLKTKIPAPALPVDPASPSAAQVLAQGSTAQLTRSNSARSMAGRKRGRSMEYARPDPRPRVGSTARPSTASSAKRPSTAPREETSLRRARSLWDNKDKMGGAGQREDVKSDRDAVIRDLKENSHFGGSQRMARTKRSLSIKRARKLNHMFGSEPPQALYVSSFVEKRLSGATISSSADLLSAQNPASRAAKHNSITSVSTTSEPSSPITATHKLPPMKGHRRHPSTPATPVADALVSGPHGEEDDIFPDEPKEVFRQRRMRAAKLSRFFGVNLHDISQSLESTPPAPRPSVAIAPAYPIPPKMSQRSSSPDGVNVRIQAPAGKFWSRNDHRREVDMNDVISRLREMR